MNRLLVITFLLGAGCSKPITPSPVVVEPRVTAADLAALSNHFQDVFTREMPKVDAPITEESVSRRDFYDLVHETLAVRSNVGKLQLFMAQHLSISLNSTNLGLMQSIWLNGVPVQVGIEKLTPVLDGFECELKFGNPTTGDIEVGNATIYWQYDVRVAANQAPHKTVIPFGLKLNSGYWTSVKLNIIPAKLDDLKGARLAFTPGQIFLHQSPVRINP